MAIITDKGHKTEHGYHIFSFWGDELYNMHTEGSALFAWRPRPKTLLTPEKEHEISRNLDDYGTKYEHEDECALHDARMQIKQRREKLQHEFESWSSKWALLSAKTEEEARIKYPWLYTNTEDTAAEASFANL